MTALTQRRSADYDKLRALQARKPSLLAITRTIGEPPRTISVRLALATARDSQFPRVRQEISEITIALPEDYPFVKPVIHFDTPVFNPNVYANNQLCYGIWKATENLEMLVVRIMRLLAFDPRIVNINSPANREASAWYAGMRRKNPGMFPTMDVDALLMPPAAPKKMIWRKIV